jgi:hypothetical protein
MPYYGLHPAPFYIKLKMDFLKKKEKIEVNQITFQLISIYKHHHDDQNNKS